MTNDLRSITISLTKFSLPLILSGILQQLYSWADAFIVGNADGEVALAAIGSTTVAINFFVTIITGFTLGLTILFAHKFGARKLDEIPKLLSTFLIVLGAAFTVLAVLGILFVTPILKLLNTTAETLSMATDYLRIIYIGIPFLAIYNVYSAALRGIGNSKTPFYAILISSVSNVILDIVLVYFLDMGVIGAALATIVSQIAMCVFTVVYSTKHSPMLKFKNRCHFSASLFKEGCRFGVPPMIQSSITSAGNLILQRFMNGFGTATVTAITTAYRVDSTVLVPVINLGSGISTLTAQNYGSKKMNEANKVFKVGMILMGVVSLALTALVIPTGGTLISLFGAGEEATAIGRAFFLRLASFYIIFGFATAIKGYLEGIGDVMYSSIFGIISLATRIMFSYIFRPHFGNMSVAFAEAVSWFVLLALCVIRLLYKRHVQNSSRIR